MFLSKVIRSSFFKIFAVKRPETFAYCNYLSFEKLKETNIKEREEAMAASKFFENLGFYKVEIGMSIGMDAKQKKDKNID